MHHEPRWLDALRRQDSAFLTCVDPCRVAAATRFADDLTRVSDEFASHSERGRGGPYMRAQVHTAVRRTGILGLPYELRSRPSAGTRNLHDRRSLGRRRADRTIHPRPPRQWPSVLSPETSDISPDMINAALCHGLPAIRQAAQCLALRTAAFDGVLLAYGTHHIPPMQRASACAEAYRVLRSGGRFVLHDFPNASPVARWFSDVVDRYSKTGHKHEHFDALEMRSLLSNAAFSDISVEMLYDPFVVMAATTNTARDALGAYLLDMYGLELMAEDIGRAAAVTRTYELANECFQYDYEALGLSADFGVRGPRYSEATTGVRLEWPRLAIVARGTRLAA
jgi:SAM-dependent methyltransferase